MLKQTFLSSAKTCEIKLHLKTPKIHWKENSKLMRINKFPIFLKSLLCYQDYSMVCVHSIINYMCLKDKTYSKADVITFMGIPFMLKLLLCEVCELRYVKMTKE